MILPILSKNPKPIALFYLLLIYTQLTLPVVVRATEINNFAYRINDTTNFSYNSSISNSKINNSFHSSIPPKSLESVANGLTESGAVQKKKFSIGPTQPEMQSFQSVNSNNMVDLFSGDFSYNIPLMDVGGYPISLHYNSGISMDQDASWVGLGWNINPGTITRNMRGLPDDFNGCEKVTKTLSMKPNRTIGVTAGVGAELLGVTTTPNGVKSKSGKLSATLGIFHNSYKGWGIETGINVGINTGTGSKGPLSAALSLTNNSQTGFDISPSIAFKMSENDSKTKGYASIGSNYNSRQGIQSLQMTGQMSQQVYADKSQRSYGGSGSSVGISFSTPSYTPSITIPFTSQQFTFKSKLGAEAWAFHPNLSVSGSASIQRVDIKELSLPAFGYLYYQASKGNQSVLLDFNREKDISYREDVPHIAVPSFTYDTYSISGEGTGGMFRPYRNDIGYIYDHAMSSKSSSDNRSFDLGFGSVLHTGFDFNTTIATTKNNPWYSENIIKDVIGFKDKDSTFENVYFKNPGEKTAVDQNYNNLIGDTSLMRVDLNALKGDNSPSVIAARTLTKFENVLPGGQIAFTKDTYKKLRAKRIQVISYLTAGEAKDFALDHFIKSYFVNQFPSSVCNTNYGLISRVDEDRKINHVSEMTVLNADGRRYIYGIPVYNFNQKDVSYAVEAGKANSFTGQTVYKAGDDNISNINGKDGYYNKEELPGYAHSFLLSGILSPDYQDITGDGITEDDNGDAIRFNYSRIFNKTNSYSWRAPFDSLAFNEGLKTDSRDERGSYSYGEREVWYMNSVESKSMIATFVLDTDSSRLDGYGANMGGGINLSKKLFRLREINLYTKADVTKNGIVNSKPIKTVHFAYSYELCKNNPSSSQSTGKLTLKKIWFTYNKNDKGQLNPYVFQYHNNNPNYLKGATDRWGCFKDSRDNPVQINNSDYPYALQDSAKAANNAAAWTLTNIKLPSGGKIQVTYESDDYAYVQNKRAMAMFSLMGFGSTSSSSPVSNLYKPSSLNSDYQYVFIKVSEAVSSKSEISTKYLDGVSELFFKLFVKMPDDRKWGSGSEYVPFYAEIDGDNYGVKGSAQDKIIWIKLKSVKEGIPSTVAALQFLRLNLPGKAYPGSEPGESVDIKDAIVMILSAGENIKSAISGFGNYGRLKNWCNSITPGMSFVRLNCPGFSKMGGGLRVKKVEVSDNFSQMTGNKQVESTYGQTYSYVDSIDINGVLTKISSGVATYEPSIGNDENPFHRPLNFKDKPAPLAPANYLYTEYPLTESYFPAPSVGYSNVIVQTIHKDKKSANGFEQTRYYTSHDFPVVTEFTPLDPDSKKTYNPKLANYFHFMAQHNVTLSQGFKIELNDMNGKVRSQASYAQTDLVNPLSYTYNYYNVENEKSLHKRLSNNVAIAESSDGIINPDGQIGKDIEVMIDVREQTSRTISGSVETNVDFASYVPPVILASVIPLPSSETDRYRSIAVMKVVQRYGILDSVIHIEKGSIVSTKNMVYDGETGDVLLSRTNNEFDDPVFNFSYPAHWAYSGMGPTYKNIGSVWTNVNFKQGKVFNVKGEELPVSQYFESGDELMVQSRSMRSSPVTDICSPLFYVFDKTFVNQKIWAIDASKGFEAHKGIYFIDKDGQPFNATAASIKIIRSGKRNLSSTQVGSITSLKNPLKVIGGKLRFVFDSSSSVITAASGSFNDFWRVDSSTYRKDTIMMMGKLADSITVRVIPSDMLSVERQSHNNKVKYLNATSQYFNTYSYDNGSGSLDAHEKSWLKFELQSYIPANAIIKSATLTLNNNEISGSNVHRNDRGSNESYLRRTRGPWIKQHIIHNSNLLMPNAKLTQVSGTVDYFNEYGLGSTDLASQVTINATPANEASYRSDLLNVTSMVQGMVDDYYTSNGTIATALVMDQKYGGGTQGEGKYSQLYYNNCTPPIITAHGGIKNCYPEMTITYYVPCASGTNLVYSSTPVPGYYCYTEPKDTFVCRPNIVESGTNPFRWGIYGNWRMTRAYTYYDKRAETDPSSTTNIRKDGEIKGFVPYWTFNDNNYLVSSSDTNRWVWNSEMNLFNRKGFEIENKDPLNRYNSGQYGYNQTMPVAVAQNSKSREKAFNGFEDDDYGKDFCTTCDASKFFDLAKSGGARSAAFSHTGRYSLKLNGNQTVSTQFKIETPAGDLVKPSLSLRVDSVATIKTVVKGEGTGLQGTYRYDVGANEKLLVRTDPSIAYYFGKGAPQGFNHIDDFEIIWDGQVQPLYTDDYLFKVEVDDEAIVYLNNVRIIRPQDSVSAPIRLIAGQLYKIRLVFTEHQGFAKIFLRWESKSGQQPREVIPQSQLYLPGITQSQVNRTIKSDTSYCVSLNKPKTTRGTLDAFSPIQGTKMVVGAWIKEEQACLTGSYASSQLQVLFNVGSPTSIIMKPTGNIIEGWQRIEGVVTVPLSAGLMTLNFMATSATPVYFDDVRVHPFNGNMKSFVYDPINLRLMAELDENNYATFYEYDDDGTLIRQKKETERGIKTIKETRSALIKD